MKILPSLLFISLLLFLACNTTKDKNDRFGNKPTSYNQKPPIKPKLVVLLSVDQMRYDYFERFGKFFKGGLKRLWEEGAVLSNAHHDHSITATGPGHAAISTGRHPAHNGIAGNSFFDRKAKKSVYCVEDLNANIIGVENDGSLPGRSPENLLVTTLGDWLKKSNRRSKVFSVAIKDRSSILMGGKNADQAFWFDDLSTKFVSSDYYKQAIPGWAKTIVGAQLFAKELDRGWRRILPESAYQGVSRVDDFEPEKGTFYPAFPHTKQRMRSGIAEARKTSAFFRVSPIGDQFAIAFAKQVIINEKLGTDEYTDVLAIGCSAADGIGHHFGPMSQEVQDYYLHLDAFLEDFLKFLDKEVGEGQYVIAMSADHGVVPMPEYSRSQGLEARRIPFSEVKKVVEKVEQTLKTTFGLKEKIVLSTGSSGISLNYKEAKAKGISSEVLQTKAAQVLKGADFIEDAFVEKELIDGNGRPYLPLFQHSYHPDRGPEIKIRFKEYFLLGYAKSGTGHGSPYSYDSHVPIVFYGPQFRKGQFEEKAATVDIAPTLAHLLNIQPLNEVDGKVLGYVMKENF